MYGLVVLMNEWFHFVSNYKRLWPHLCRSPQKWRRARGRRNFFLVSFPRFSHLSAGTLVFRSYVRTVSCKRRVCYLLETFQMDDDEPPSSIWKTNEYVSRWRVSSTFIHQLLWPSQSSSKFTFSLEFYHKNVDYGKRVLHPFRVDFWFLCSYSSPIPNKHTWTLHILKI